MMSFKEHLMTARKELELAINDLEALKVSIDTALEGTSSLDIVPARPRRQRGGGGTRVKGTVGLPEAVQKLFSGREEPLTAQAIYELAYEMGYRTDSENPADTVDLQLYKMKANRRWPLEKVGPRTWRWVQEA